MRWHRQDPTGITVTSAENNGRRRVWYVFAGVVALTPSAYFVYFPITNTDIWWHLAAAREMLSSKSILFVDPFAYTLERPEWIDIHWGFQLIVHWLRSTVGFGGIVITKCIVTAIVGALLMFVNRENRRRAITALIFTFLIHEARYLVLARPIMVTLPAIALYLLVISEYYRTGKAKLFLLLIPVQLLWANTQGLFVLGPVIAGGYAAGEAVSLIKRKNGSISYHPRTFRALLSVTIGAMLVSFLNPYGWRGALLPFKLFGRIDPRFGNIYSQNVSENLPLRDMLTSEPRLAWITIGITLVSIFFLWAGRRRVRWGDVFVLLGFLWLAFSAQRNILLYFVVLTPFLGRSIADILPGPTARDTSLHPRSAGALSLVFFLFVWVVSALPAHARTIALYPQNRMVSPFRVPAGAADFIEKHGVTGRVFNTIRYGGYLIYRFYPDKQVFIDGRLVIRSPAFFAEYLAILDNPEYFEPVANKFSITHAVLPISVYTRALPLVKALYDWPNWDPVYCDGNSIVFVGKGFFDLPVIDPLSPEGRAEIEAEIVSQWKNDPAIRREAGYWLENLIGVLKSHDSR